MLISLVLAVVVTILAAYFASNNLTAMQITLLGYSVKGTTGIMIVSAFGGGVLLGVLLMLPALISRSWALIRHKRKLQDLQGTMQRGHTDEEAQRD